MPPTPPIRKGQTRLAVDKMEQAAAIPEQSWSASIDTTAAGGNASLMSLAGE